MPRRMPIIGVTGSRCRSVQCPHGLKRALYEGLSLRIVFVTNRDISSASADTHYYMFEAIRSVFPCTKAIQTAAKVGFQNRRVLTQYFDRIRGLGGQSQELDISESDLKQEALRVDRAIREFGQVDLVFGYMVSSFFAYSQHEGPRIHCSDATMHAIAKMDYKHKLSEKSLNIMDQVERKAIQRSAWSCFPVEWAANSAIREYQGDPDRISILPSGPNLPTSVIPKEPVIRTWRPGELLQLVFLGNSWKRKGGQVAIKTVEQLVQMGIDARLIVVGHDRPKQSHPRVRHVRYLSKDHPAQLARLLAILRESHLLLLPTRGDTNPGAIREAMAFALPPVVNGIGGIPELVENGVSGLLFSPDSEPHEYAESIARLINDCDAYHSMQLNAYDVYAGRQNWGEWSLRFKKIVESVVSS